MRSAAQWVAQTATFGIRQLHGAKHLLHVVGTVVSGEVLDYYVDDWVIMSGSICQCHIRLSQMLSGVVPHSDRSGDAGSNMIDSTWRQRDSRDTNRAPAVLATLVI